MKKVYMQASAFEFAGKVNLQNMLKNPALRGFLLAEIDMIDGHIQLGELLRGGRGLGT